MSYLDVPRLYLGGSFYTDPSTVNNDPNHYNPKNGPPSPWQSPQGQHHFKLVGCNVVGGVNEAGEAPDSDPAIGVAFASTDVYTALPAVEPGPTVSPAKIVDLDVYQQAVSTIYGLQVTMTVGDATLTGDVYPPPVLNSTWFGRVLPTRAWGDSGGNLGYGDDSNAVGTFQSQIRIPLACWPASVSPLVDALRKATYADAEYVYLSIKIVLDSYVNANFDGSNASYFTGRLVGAIGPVRDEFEPAQTPAARWLTPRPAPDRPKKKPDPWFYPKFYGAPFKIDDARKTLVIDLAASLTTQSVNGPPVDLGTLSAIVQRVDGNIGSVAYNAFAYATTAGIAELPLTDVQYGMLLTSPLVLRTSRTDIGPVDILTEKRDGIWWAADSRVCRMPSDPERRAPSVSKVHLTRWGRPMEGVTLMATVVSVHGDTPGATVPSFYRGDMPSADGKLVATIAPTDARGIATLTLEVLGDPGARATYLDSQLYFVNLYYPNRTASLLQVQEQQLSVVVWESYPTIAKPSWSDVAAIMARYDALFPAMREKITLSDRHSFSVFAWNPPFGAVGYPALAIPVEDGPALTGGSIPLYLWMPEDDPRKMPLTRDLSPNKIETVLNWIAQNPPSTAAEEGSK